VTAKLTWRALMSASITVSLTFFDHRSNVPLETGRTGSLRPSGADSAASLGRFDSLFSRETGLLREIGHKRRARS
jgi:hypothetical protein